MAGDREADAEFVDAQRTLRDGVHITSLMEHLSAWEGFAYAYPEGSRLAGGMAHNRTLDYIWAHLQATCQYYHLERQPFHQTLVVSGSTALYVNGVGLYGYTMTRAKPGRYTGQLVLVAGSGCKEVSPPGCPLWPLMRGVLTVVFRVNTAPKFEAISR